MTIACTDCGTLQDIPPLPWGAIAICPTCDNRLERTNGRSINGALACASATFVLLFPANLLPLMHVSMLGMTRESRLGTGVVTLWQHQWVVVALLVAAFAIILPFVRFGLLSLVLALLQLGHRPHWLGRAFRWSLHLDQWAMPDVFLIGCAPAGGDQLAAADTDSRQPAHDHRSAARAHVLTAAARQSHPSRRDARSAGTHVAPGGAASRADLARDADDGDEPARSRPAVGCNRTIRQDDDGCESRGPERQPAACSRWNRVDNLRRPASPPPSRARSTAAPPSAPDR